MHIFLQPASSAVPNGTQPAENEGTPQILPPRTSLSGPMEGEGNNADATRRRVQVLTKDELKDMLKANNSAVTGIAKRTKDGEFLFVMLHQWC